MHEMTKILLKDEVYAIIGAAMEVHRYLGHGFLEPVYQEALEIELKEHGIPYVAQQEIPVFYKGRRLIKSYVADFIAYNQIIIEIKALPRLSPHEVSQIINYLKASGLELGLLINFGATSLEWKRMVLTKRENESS